MLRSGHARPGWQARGRATAKDERPGDRSAHSIPVALAMHKRNRVCVVGKLTRLDDEIVLAIAHRNQQGVASTISVPLEVLLYAERRNVRWLYFRRDQAGEMYCLPLADLRRIGWLGPGAGAEWYVRIGDMQRCPWRQWEYAQRTIVLDAVQAQQQQQASDVQMALWDGGAAWAG